MPSYDLPVPGYDPRNRFSPYLILQVPWDVDTDGPLLHLVSLSGDLGLGLACFFSRAVECSGIVSCAWHFLSSVLFYSWISALLSLARGWALSSILKNTFHATLRTVHAPLLFYSHPLQQAFIHHANLS